MVKVLIWGKGNKHKIVYDSLVKDKCIFCGYIDGRASELNEDGNEVYPVIVPEKIKETEYDYIVVSPLQYADIVESCKSLGISMERVILYWNDNRKYDFLDFSKRQEFLYEQEKQVLINKLDNLEYEYGLKEVPVIKNSKELLKTIKEKRSSLCRFGDGEFEIMRGNVRPWFQKPNEKLAEKLIKVINSAQDNIMIAVADNFGSLDKYTETGANEIRRYLQGSTRSEIMNFLSMEREYWDTYVTRPYMIYKDKNNAAEIFELWKGVWNNRNVLIVEGKNGRMGIDNDLLEGANSVRRIVCPAKDCFDKYNQIYDTVNNSYREDDLILISLGPTATVLAYDLALTGKQAIDIGQIDNEYDWFTRKVQSRTDIPNKCVAEVNGGHKAQGELSELYTSQIIDVVD
ncbi:MAG: GT-D fold domain-containing glycosyltransferase [Lachnospira sp.]